MATDPLLPLRAMLSEHRVSLLPVASDDMRPGMLLNPKGEVLDYLTDLSAGVKTFFTPLGKPISLGVPVEASFAVDEVTIKTQLGGKLGLSLLNVGSIKTAAKATNEVTMRIGALFLQRIQAGTDALGQPSYLEGADYCLLANKNLSWKPFKPTAELMKARTYAFPVPRKVEIAQALVYVESIELDFGHSFSVEVEASLQADISAGVGVTTSGKGRIVLTPGMDVPLGFIPVRYAWKVKDKTFVTVSN